MLSSVVVVLLLLLLTGWLYSKKRHSFWASQGVPTVPYTLPFIGHIHKMFLSRSQRRWDFDREVYTKHGGSKYVGLYELLNPILMVGDPELLKHIFVKDFDHFVDRRLFPKVKGSLIGDMLSNLAGNDWKELRAIMTPTFSSGKIKGMFPLVCEKADTLVAFSLKESMKKGVVDMKHNCGRFAMDTIASCAFGIECNSFTDQEAEFSKAAESFFSFSIITGLKFALLMMLPKVCQALNISIETEASAFFRAAVKQTIDARMKGEKRGDFLDLLLEARKNSSQTETHQKEVLSDTTIQAQCVMFLIAGYDTTASTLAFSSHLLAKNIDQQQRLRQELQDLVAEHGSITYQSIMEAKFLDACLMETLRLYSPAFVLERVCTKEYSLPGTDVKLKTGQIVSIPVYSLHRDPKHWTEPEEFRPDRFLPENKGNIKSFTHMPFGMGPRNCIAMRFALMEAKVALAKMVLAAEFQLAPGCENMELESSPFLFRPKDGGVKLVLHPLREE